MRGEEVSPLCPLPSTHLPPPAFVLRMHTATAAYCLHATLAAARSDPTDHERVAKSPASVVQTTFYSFIEWNQHKTWPRL